MSIEQLNEDLAILNTRKEQAYNSYHQILGAIDIIQQMIFRHDQEEAKKSEEKPKEECKEEVKDEESKPDTQESIEEPKPIKKRSKKKQEPLPE